MRTEVRTGGDGQLSVLVEGAFDTPDVDTLVALVESLWRSSPARPLTLDFREAREVSDYAISRLARETHGGPTRVSLVGLSLHQHRLLQYLGDNGASRPPAAGAPRTR